MRGGVLAQSQADLPQNARQVRYIRGKEKDIVADLIWELLMVMNTIAQSQQESSFHLFDNDSYWWLFTG